MSNAPSVTPRFRPFVVDRQDDKHLHLRLAPQLIQRLTAALTLAMIGVCWLGVAGLLWLLVMRTDSLAKGLFAAVAMVVLVGTAKLMKMALTFDAVSAVQFEPDGVVIVSGRGKRATTTRIAREDCVRLRTSAGVNRYRGQVRSRWVRLVLETTAEPVSLGWLVAEQADDPATHAAVALLANYLAPAGQDSLETSQGGQ